MRHTLALVVLLTGFVTAVSAAPYELTRDGAPTSAIVLEPTPTRAAQFAAFELQAHVRKITGAVLPILAEGAPVATGHVLLAVGQGAAAREAGLPATGFQPQEYAIRCRPGQILLVGRDQDDRGRVEYDLDQNFEAFRTWPDYWAERGTLNAVYDFLERCCGVRWYNPTEFGTVYTATRTLRVSPADLRRAPFFRCRNAWAGGNVEGYDAVNVFWPPNTEPFRQYEQSAYADLHRRFTDGWRYVHAKRATVMAWLLRRRAGGEKCFANHSLYAYYDRFWARNPKNAEVFGGQHADWFAQGYAGKPPQLCYTNRGLIAQVAQDARDYFDGKGRDPWAGRPLPAGQPLPWGQDCFAVEPMDNNQFCQCAACQALLGDRDGDNTYFTNGRHSDYFFRFVNEVAKELRRTHPDKRIVTLAYMSHGAPPVRLKLEPNVVVQFCFAANRLHYDRRPYEDEVRLLRQWAGAKDRPLYLWLYDTFPNEVAAGGGFHCFPGFFARTVGEQFRLFRELGLQGMFHCGYGQEVEADLTFRLMDDPAAPVEPLLEEYFRRYYEGAGPAMKALYTAIEQTYGDPANYPPYVRDNATHDHQTEEIAWGWLGTAERMARFQALLDQAKAAADTDLARRRVALFETGTWSYMVQGRKVYLDQLKARYTGREARRVPFVSGEAPDGDLRRCDWTEAAVLTDWRARLGEPGRREVRGSLLADATRLYLRLHDATGGGGDWTVLAAAQRGWPVLRVRVKPGEAAVCERLDSAGAAPVAVTNALLVVATGGTAQLVLPRAALPGATATPARVYLNVRRQAGDAEVMYSPSFGEFTDPARLVEFLPDAAETIPTVLPSRAELAALARQDLVGLWRALGAAGAVRDESGQGLHGRLVNAPKQPAGVALSFDDGHNQYVDLGNPPALNLTGPLSLVAWVRYEPTSTWYPAIMGKGYEGSGAYSLHIRPGGTLWFEVDEPNGTRHHYNPTDLALSPGVWTHVAATYDGQFMRVYVNGRETGAGRPTKVTVRQTGEPFRLGWLGSYGFFNGDLDEVAVYRRALSAGEVFARFRAGLPVHAVGAVKGSRP